MDWVQIIGSLGFPIVACIFLFKQNIDIEKKHAEEMTSLMQSLNNNTLALNHLADRIEFEKEIKDEST